MIGLGRKNGCSALRLHKETDVPPFVIGRIGYDNWLVDKAYHLQEQEDARGVPRVSLVDVSDSVKALHQTDEKGSRAGFRSPDWHWNYDLAYAHAKANNLPDHF